jgi:hypothetical protein
VLYFHSLSVFTFSYAFSRIKLHRIQRLQCVVHSIMSLVAMSSLKVKGLSVCCNSIMSLVALNSIKFKGLSVFCDQLCLQFSIPDEVNF